MKANSLQQSSKALFSPLSSRFFPIFSLKNQKNKNQKATTTTTSGRCAKPKKEKKID